MSTDERRWTLSAGISELPTCVHGPDVRRGYDIEVVPASALDAMRERAERAEAGVARIESRALRLEGKCNAIAQAIGLPTGGGSAGYLVPNVESLVAERDALREALGEAASDLEHEADPYRVAIDMRSAIPEGEGRSFSQGMADHGLDIDDAEPALVGALDELGSPASVPVDTEEQGEAMWWNAEMRVLVPFATKNSAKGAMEHLSNLISEVVCSYHHTVVSGTVVPVPSESPEDAALRATNGEPITATIAAGEVDVAWRRRYAVEGTSDERQATAATLADALDAVVAHEKWADEEDAREDVESPDEGRADG